MEIDEIKRHPSVLRIYTDRVRFKRDGREMVGNCCFHSEKSPSLRLFEQDGTLLFKCFGCGKSGSVVDFVAAYDKISIGAAIKKVKDYVESSFAGNKEKVESVFHTVGQEEVKKQTYSAQEYEKYERALENNQAARDWLLKERGISMETARRLRIGYRQDVGKLCGDGSQDICDKGWLAFPTLDAASAPQVVTVTSIKYRSLVKKAFCKQSKMGTYLFNLNTVDFLEPVFLVSGEFDACVLEQAGVRAVSLPGDNIQVLPEWKDSLLKADCVILAGDNDDSGKKIMSRLWAEMQERTYLLNWPGTCKDANDFWNECKRDSVVFRKRISELVSEAKSKPMASVYDIREVMLSAGQTTLSEHPDRLRWPWAQVDTMANALPGAVVFLFASSTGTGKTTFLTQMMLHNAKKYGRPGLIYSGELTTDEMATLVTAQTLRKDRNFLTSEDHKQAAGLLGEAKLYIGRDPDLSKVDQVIDLIESAVRRLSPKIVAVDHIHFLVREEADTVKAQENAMRRLKNLAGKYGVIVVVLGQPRKASQQTRGKIVDLSDAKGSESCASDSDVVLVLHRDSVKNLDPNNPPKEPFESTTKVILKKGRSQGTGNSYCELCFLGPLATFSELTHDSPPDSLNFG